MDRYPAPEPSRDDSSGDLPPEESMPASSSSSSDRPEEPRRPGNGVSTNQVQWTNGSSPTGSSADNRATVGSARPGPVCRVCPLRSSCRAICDVIEALLPSPERGRVDAEDLPRLYSGIRMRRALLDYSHLLTEKQQEVVRLYYRESLQQHEIAERLGVTQQAVHDSLRRARKTIGERVLRGGSQLALQSDGNDGADDSRN